MVRFYESIGFESCDCGKIHHFKVIVFDVWALRRTFESFQVFLSSVRKSLLLHGEKIGGSENPNRTVSSSKKWFQNRTLIWDLEVYSRIQNQYFVQETSLFLSFFVQDFGKTSIRVVKRQKQEFQAFVYFSNTIFHPSNSGLHQIYFFDPEGYAGTFCELDCGKRVWPKVGKQETRTLARPKNKIPLSFQDRKKETRVCSIKAPRSGDLGKVRKLKTRSPLDSIKVRT